MDTHYSGPEADDDSGKRDEFLGQDHRIIHSAHPSGEFIRGLWRTNLRQKLAEVLGGRIALTCEDGKGSPVTLTLPVNTPEARG